MKMQRKKMMFGVGAALCVALFGGAKLRAQMAPGGGFETPEMAASSLVGLMELVKKSPTMPVGGEPMFQQYISLKDKKQVGEIGATLLLGELFQQAATPQTSATTQQRSESSAVVSVVPQAQTEYKPIVCIKEDGRWRIDLTATYARWNGVDEKTALSQLMPLLTRVRDNALRVSCQNNLKQIALGMLQYTQDYDENYPPAKKWIDVLAPYTRTEEIYHCPAVPGDKYGYAMNWRFSGKSDAIVMKPAETATLYDSRTLKRNAVGGGGKDIAFRHSGGANFAYADGHIKFSTPQNVPNFLLDPNTKK